MRFFWLANRVWASFARFSSSPASLFLFLLLLSFSEARFGRILDENTNELQSIRLLEEASLNERKLSAPPFVYISLAAAAVVVVVWLPLSRLQSVARINPFSLGEAQQVWRRRRLLTQKNNPLLALL